MSDSDLDFGDDDNDDVSGDFNSAAIHVQQVHDWFTPEALLKLYGLYKQATVGRCDTTKPSIFQMTARRKWCAWNELGDLSSTEAKSLYVKEVQELDPHWRTDAEIVNSGGTVLKMPLNWVVHSAHLRPDDPEASKPEHEKTSFDYVKEQNLNRLRQILKPENLTELDNHGMALTHWAADRNAPEILEYLLTEGADINQRDNDLQTPLHYAASCGHIDVLRLLLKYDADYTLCDIEGRSVLDVAETEEARSLLLK